MCSCASCSYTDSFAGAGFAAWPRGNPSGPRKSASEYSEHVSFGQRIYRQIQEGIDSWEPVSFLPDWYRKIPKQPVYSCRGSPGCGPLQTMPQWWYAWNAKMVKTTAALATAARPTHPGKGERHLPELDRQRESAVIYAMPKEKPKRPVGRPPMPGRRVVVKLEERQIKAAEKLGRGNVAAGIRKALGA